MFHSSLKGQVMQFENEVVITWRNLVAISAGFFLAGFFIASCIFIFWWRKDAMESNKENESLCKKLLEKETYLFITCIIFDTVREFATFDKGVSWWSVKRSSHGLSLESLDKDQYSQLITSLREKIPLVPINTEITLDIFD